MPVNNIFQTRQPNIAGNPALRTPQVRTFQSLEAYQGEESEEREVGIVLPVGCGKSGCICLAPFAFGSTRTLVVAPGVRIATQLGKDFDPSDPRYFYTRCAVLTGAPFPEPVEIRGNTTNVGDLEEADVVITNIQQLQGQNNRWLSDLPPDFFDLILFDEGHHSVAATWETLKAAFPRARIVNFSATPMRSDGQRMAGRILYSYPVFEAIREGYVKRLKALVLNPRTLRYVRREDGEEIEVPLEEVRRLGEVDADFRRSIVTSIETLATIVSASIRELDRIRAETGDQRHKIIASALNFEHCRQVVEAYRARGKRADYVHSREESAANDLVMQRLENHEIDVIVQVRKLGEGFDHPYLSVAAVCSLFANLSPFVQFVGRIMRVVVQNDPTHLNNQGTVVFHAGANVAQQWQDFQLFSEADQDFFDQLLPIEGLDFGATHELEVVPHIVEIHREVDVRAQGGVDIVEIPLIEDDAEAMRAIQILRERGYTAEQVRHALELQPVPVTRARERQAARASLDERIRNATGRILGRRQLNPQGHDLDTQRRGRTNFVVVKAAIDRSVNASVGRDAGQRHEFTREELDQIDTEFDELVATAERELFDA